MQYVAATQSMEKNLTYQGILCIYHKQDNGVYVQKNWWAHQKDCGQLLYQQ